MTDQNPVFVHEIDDPTQLRAMLDAKADPNLYKEGATPLMKSKNPLITEILIEYKANPNLRTYPYGWRPLHFASYECAKVLLEAKADPNQGDDDKVTPLHMVNDAKTAQLLIDHGADVNQSSCEHATPLHECQNPAIVKILLDSKADPNPQHFYGQDTPLHKTHNLDVINYLIQAKGDLYMKTTQGLSCLYYFLNNCVNSSSGDTTISITSILSALAPVTRPYIYLLTYKDFSVSDMYEFMQYGADISDFIPYNDTNIPLDVMHILHDSGI